MRYLIFPLCLFATPLLWADYLGTNRADVEAGLRMYTEKQLADTLRKQKETRLPAEPIHKPEEQASGGKSWDEDIAQMVPKAPEMPMQLPMPMQPPMIWEAPSATKLAPSPNDWKQVGGQGLGERKVEARPSDHITIPSGSYIMGELMTGVDAPTQEAIPALIRTRFGFVSPNEGFVDLSGCHVVAKATGDLSTERIRVKTVTLSCLSPEKVPYEQDIEAYAAGEDGGFGLPGELRSRQGRVAMMAFLNGVVEGATKIVSETSSIMVSPMSALGSQGSSSASVELVRWYLEHAKSILPTVESKAGAPLRLVLMKPLQIPKSFFIHYTHPKEFTHAQRDLIL